MCIYQDLSRLGLSLAAVFCYFYLLGRLSVEDRNKWNKTNLYFVYLYVVIALCISLVNIIYRFIPGIKQYCFWIDCVELFMMVFAITVYLMFLVHRIVTINPMLNTTKRKCSLYAAIIVTQLCCATYKLFTYDKHQTTPETCNVDRIVYTYCKNFWSRDAQIIYWSFHGFWNVILTVMCIFVVRKIHRKCSSKQKFKVLKIGIYTIVFFSISTLSSLFILNFSYWWKQFDEVRQLYPIDFLINSVMMYLMAHPTILKWDDITESDSST
eukprot:83587_1